MTVLGEIFIEQRALMEKYHVIEEANTDIFYYQDGHVPVDLNTIGGAARLKHLAWYVIEEVAEALDAQTVAEAQEEVSDAMHFLSELYITAGYTEDFWFNSLQQIFDTTPQQSLDVAVRELTESLGLAMHKLKCKPWKKTLTPTDMEAFELHLRATLYAYVGVCKAFGIMSAHQLQNIYFRKAQINRGRQESGY